MANRICFALKYRNVIYLEREWVYGELITPTFYYQYLPLEAHKYKFVYKANKFIMYERIQKKIPSGEVVS